MIKQSRNAVGIWLMAGVVMMIIQTMLGGITRLTGSGLSITEWDFIPGTIPPLNEVQWEEEFGKYRQTTQYELLNADMTLSGFKSIFWWEYLHRLWGRLIGIAFLIPFVIFLIRRQIDWNLGRKLLIAFVLGAIQGVVGWIMVMSGLKDQPWVNPVKLSIHLILAIILISYVFWMALDELSLKPGKPGSAALKRPLTWITALLFLQIFYGGLMAGNHAALFYPTFPKFGSEWIPKNLFILSPKTINFIQNMGMIQVIHRSLGLVIGIMIFAFWLKARKFSSDRIFRKAAHAFQLLVIIQIALGILTLLNSLGKIPVVYGVTHQLCAVLLLLLSLFLLYQSTHSAEKNFSAKSKEEAVTIP